MKGHPLGPDGEDITWPDQVAPWLRNVWYPKRQTSNLKPQLELVLQELQISKGRLFTVHLLHTHPWKDTSDFGWGGTMHERIARHQWFETIQEVYVSCAVPLSDHLLLPLHYILISLRSCAPPFYA